MGSKHDILPAIVIGGGPAGLAAAEMLGQAGIAAWVLEAKPSLARKFLMAGKSGLNLTKAEPLAQFLTAYEPQSPVLLEALSRFGPVQIQDWAEDLGQSLFTGSSGRVFPQIMKGSPLLRAWLARLASLSIVAKTGWRLACLFRDGSRWHCQFDTPDGPQILRAETVVLALGGASWARLGADGRWADMLEPMGIPITPFKPANMGFDLSWSPHMEAHFGQPLKGIALQVGAARVEGECVISRPGLEGSAIYAISAPLRDALLQAGGPVALSLDLLPRKSVQDLEHSFQKAGRKQSIGNVLRKIAKLDPAKKALAFEAGKPPSDPSELAAYLKALPLQVARPRPMDEAISVAGGLRWSALSPDFMLQDHPGLFAAGEMLDWEAPTGGYLLTGCIATGRAAGQGAVRYLAR